MNKYTKLKVKLGEGSYKTVYKAIDEEEGKEVAYNEVKIKSYEEETQTISSFSKEIALLKNIDHKYIIRIFDYWFSEDNFVFITELMTGGTIRDYINRAGNLKIQLIKKWGQQILEGLSYLHSLNPPVVHRDIKNENIFVSSQGDIKIGDLGVAKERKHKRYTIIGTPNFMAREMFEGEGYSEKVDIYAFGMCLIEMATGVTPFNELKENSEVYKSVLQGMLPKSLHKIDNNCLKSIVMGCLVSQENRFSATMCLKHHFFHSHVHCEGDCLPKICSTIYPLPYSKDMELSIVSLCEQTISFQILLKDSGRFIKFDYDISKDSPQKVYEELKTEMIALPDDSEQFMNLLATGVNIALAKRNTGKIIDGIIELDSAETNKIEEGIVLINNHKSPDKESDEIAGITSNSDTESSQIGQKTIEVMQEIDQEMKALEKKKLAEKRREEETTMRLNAKLEGKSQQSIISDELKRMSIEHVYDQFPHPEESSNHGINNSSKFSTVNEHIIPSSNSSISIHNFSSSSYINNSNQNPNIQCPPHCQSALNEHHKHLENNKTTPENVQMSASDTDKTHNACPQCSPNNDILEIHKKNIICNEQSNSSNENLASDVLTSQHLHNEKIISNGPTLFVNNNVSKPSEDHHIYSPPITSPPFYSTKLMEEQVANDQSLNESYLIAKNKYKSNYNVTQFALDAAVLTGRTEDTAKSWIKALKDEDIETVYDLKLIVYEDWEKLPLTVFSSRAMQNMLHGIGNIPLKEKQLPLNPKLKDYEDSMSIKEFLTDVCNMIGRPELAVNWENKLMAQDLQTVAELKSLHLDDWNRLGLSVFGYRILKNVIYRKGKIVYE